MNALLCLGVILIHLNNTPLSQLPPGHGGYVVAFAANKLLCFAVPAFLFLSGFKLFARYGSEKMSVWRFYIGRFRKILLPYFVAVVVYFVYFYIKGWVLLDDLPEYVFLGTLAAHFYYVVIAVQLYLLFPLLRLAADRWPRITLAASLLCTVVFQQFLVFPYSDRFFGSYLFYFVLGMWMARGTRGESTGRRRWMLPAATLALGILHTCLSHAQTEGTLAYSYHGTVNVLYVTFATLTVFGACIKLGDRPVFLRLSRGLGGASYEIYLYHVLLIFFLQYDLYPRLSLGVAACYGSSCLAVYGACALGAWVKCRVKDHVGGRLEEKT